MSALAEATAQLRSASDARLASGRDPLPVPVDGLEAVIAGTLLALGRGDWWVPGPRERVGAVLRAVPEARLLGAYDGARPYKIAPASPSPGLRALHAVGLALSAPDRAVAVHLGVGSAASGDFHEALNLAALLRPNVIFVVAVHALAGEAPLGPQLGADPVHLAAAFGVAAIAVHGRDPGAVQHAVAAARAAGGPQVVVAQL